MASSLIALAVTAIWVLAGAQLPSPHSERAPTSPLALVLIFTTAKGLGAVSAAVAWSIAIDIALAAALAILLAVRSRTNPHAQRLGLALGNLSAGMSLLFIASALPPLADWITRPWPGNGAFAGGLISTLACAGIAFSLLGIGMWMLARFWMEYPTPVDSNALQAFVQHRHDAAHHEGRRLLGRLFPTDEASSARAVAQCALLADTHEWRESALGRSLARKCALAAGIWWLGAAVAGLFRMDLSPGFGSLLVGGLALTTAAASLHPPLSSIAEVIAFQATSEDSTHRRRIEWVQVVGAWGYLVTNSFLPVAFLAAVPLMLLFPALANGLLDTLFLMSFVLPFTVLPGLLVLALAAAIFARGLVDPRLALRKVSLWTLLGLAIAFVFVLVERVVALQLVRWLALPAEWGAIIAGVAVAVTFVPIRRTVEKRVNDFVEQRMPTRLLASGEAHVGAVAVVDISGFTALSAHDEPAALLATTLLQREARRLADAHDGRVVKYIGDGAMLAFDDANDAAATLRQLHAAFVRGLEALSLPPLMLHSGAHWGEYVDVRGADIYGHTVNIASRLADAAAPGEILVSRAFAVALGPHEPEPVPAGVRHFKNVPQPVDCLRLSVPA